jgi:hypothetical protein
MPIYAISIMVAAEAFTEATRLLILFIMPVSTLIIQQNLLTTTAWFAAGTPVTNRQFYQAPACLPAEAGCAALNCRQYEW